LLHRPGPHGQNLVFRATPQQGGEGEHRGPPPARPSSVAHPPNHTRAPFPQSSGDDETQNETKGAPDASTITDSSLLPESPPQAARTSSLGTMIGMLSVRHAFRSVHAPAPGSGERLRGALHGEPPRRRRDQK